ncbi:MAG TPA: response regulator transcription factor [Ramlibacter sp.]|uniref:response regulator transcription factor n=1 Tax=Ramlibacter sp. TaxID=1917967 RepID=UPI002D031ECB|nr:response regulator transcription factor [Ramlibacter sp.]HVZ44811.1 response regulator transcription factor [Ramlibacter sp.]
MSKTVLVVDDHPLFRKALVGLVEESGAGASVLAAASAEEGLQRVRESTVDLILLDLGLPGAASADAIALFRRACSADIVVVSASEHRQEIAAATRAGASMVVSKSVSMDTLKEIVQRALEGAVSEQKWIRPAGSLSLTEESGHGLTTRQQEIAALLMNGYSNKEIGMRLGLAEITVKTHLTAIFRLLGVVNRTQAVVAIRRLGIAYGAAEGSPVAGSP